ncbi:MAG: GNAT family N-acetyltransferase [Candidatus Hydrogenedentes bacterium]|nr:GNAT family N-acetyltransferase [Candidatus Hydrogenedentota bacterium]
MSQLRMEKRGISSIPDHALPDGYGLRTYRDGDEFAIARIYAASQLGKESAESVRAEILGDPCFTADRMFILEYGGEVVGTASAWVTDEEPEVGYLHMIGLLDEHRGKGLGMALACAALRYTRDEGFDTQRLLTDDWREAAIRLYIDLGYDPLITDRTHPARWTALAARLDRPQLLSRMRRMEPAEPEPFLSRLRRILGFATLV